MLFKAGQEFLHQDVLFLWINFYGKWKTFMYLLVSERDYAGWSVWTHSQQFTILSSGTAISWPDSTNSVSFALLPPPSQTPPLPTSHNKEIKEVSHLGTQTFLKGSTLGGWYTYVSLLFIIYSVIFSHSLNFSKSYLFPL